jgi:hypothetical protein
MRPPPRRQRRGGRFAVRRQIGRRDCREGRAEQRGELVGDRRTDAGARIGPDEGAIEAVVARRDVVEAGLVQPKLWRDVAEFTAEGGEQAGVERRYRARSADRRHDTMNEHVIARIRVGVGGNVGNHTSRALRRAGLPRLRRKQRGKTTARAVAARIAGIVVPDAFVRCRFGRAAAADDEWARGRQIDISRRRTAIGSVVVAGRREHDHACVGCGLRRRVQLAGIVEACLLAGGLPVRLVGAQEIEQTSQPSAAAAEIAAAMAPMSLPSPQYTRISAGCPVAK